VGSRRRPEQQDDQKPEQRLPVGDRQEQHHGRGGHQGEQYQAPAFHEPRHSTTDQVGDDETY
jgi:hypothetical protein